MHIIYKGDLMIIKYIILAFIQGITEPLPISSSGHMLLFRAIFNVNMPNDLNFEIICNFGSFIAIFLIYRKDILSLLKNTIKYFKNKKLYINSFNYLKLIIISTIPVCITGLLFKNILEKTFNRTWFLAFSFLITCISLFIIRNKKGYKDDYQITIKDAIIIGLFQSITIIPGISRCGTVLVACLLCNLKKDTALKYTFMLYFPVSIASMLLGINDLLNMPNFRIYIVPYSISMITSGIITYLSYNWLSTWLKKGKIYYFAIYCFVLFLFILFYFR